MSKSYLIKISAVAVLLSGVFFSTANASHSWGNYHFGRTSNPFTLKLGDNLSSAWDSYLSTSSSDWNSSSVLETVIVPGGTTAKRCRAINGTGQVCNSQYGNNGWLGVAQIWISGNHITQGTVKVNDTYFNTAKYNTSAWKNLVMCQEIGHIFGLDHQDENFNNANLNTCMDYTSNPGTNQHPNAHDYAQLETIYSHLDSVTTVSQTSASANGRARINSANLDDSDTELRGEERRRDSSGRTSLYETHDGRGEKVITFIIWAE